ncbi:MAG: hypothetical protein QM831_12020 [Kofleriaceae bacterium]
MARRAYLGLDASVEKSITLGFAGFNDATSANIPTEQDTGDAAGTLAITGQVDQGASSNKGMRLAVDMVGYSDGPFEIDSDHHTWTITYDTDAASFPALDMMLKNIPTGTITGTLIGTYHLSGDLTGDVDLDLTIAGTLQDAGGGTVTRAAGTTITGTATQGDGVYNVSVTL